MEIKFFSRMSTAYTCYIISLLIVGLGVFWLLYTQWSGIASGNGIGSFSVLWFFEYATAGIFFWLVGFYLKRNFVFTSMIFFLTIGSGSLFLFLPVMFYVDK